MSDFNRNLPPEQEAVRAKCFHPAGDFVEFKKEAIEQSIPERFEQQVARYPARIAVKNKNQTLTYDALNRRANCVARAILSQRGESQEPVALLLENDGPMIASVLGVLKAGKMYVPLDPAFPVSRNAAILADSEATLIVTNNRNFSFAKGLAATKVAWINIDELGHFISDENPRLGLAPDTLAYILYTSGSTGKPKGVVQNHRNVLHLIMRHTNRARICAEDRFALLRSFNVHGGTLQTLVALLNGAAVLPFDVREEGVQELARWLAREEITLARLGPSLLRHLAVILDQEYRFPSLREISFSGEPLRKNDLELCRKHFPEDCVLVNSFGATEVSSCCEYFIGKPCRVEAGVIPCGYPTTDMELLLLDDNGKEVDFGQIGEIAVRSRYLAPGYWRKPELTQARFLTDPKEGSTRVYLTGDIGRMLPDGCLVHLGRKDFQIKLRGYRVEVGEVESTLLEMENINEAVVVTEEHGEQNRLVAYFVPKRKPAPSTTTLRRALEKKLLDYMVPSVFVALNAMPLTPNGKVDRRALPVPGNSRPELANAYVAPRSQAEERLAHIWAEVFSLDQVGIEDNFFDLGGHSLLASRLISRIHDIFHVRVQLRSFFAAPTVASLAAYIERALLQEREAKHFSIARVSRDGPLLLSFAQQRLWFLNQLEPHNPAYNQPKALRLLGELTIEALQKALDAIVMRHEVLRSSFASTDGWPVQIVNESRPVELSIMDLSKWPAQQRETEVQRLLREISRQPFDLCRDLMLRAAIFRLEKEHHVLLLVTHHIAFDGWSGAILLDELATLYNAFSAGSAFPLGNLPIQYADFACWQRKALGEERLKEQLSYWKEKLKDAPFDLKIPTDRPRPTVQTFCGEQLSLRLSKNLSQRLKALGQEEKATLYMTLLAAIQTLLFRYTHVDDIVVGTPISGRHRREVEGLIGIFVNTLVIRTDLSGNPTFRELLSRVRETALAAYAHQDLPFERLVEELQPERSLTHASLFQVMFAFQNHPLRKTEMSGLTIEALASDSGSAKFDLTVRIYDEDQGLRCLFEYDATLFDETCIRRMVGHFQTMLNGIVTNPDLALSDLPLLTQVEQRQLLVEWNDSQRNYPIDQCVHQLFEDQANRTPDAIAVVFNDEKLTYRELNQRANQLAHYLCTVGVGPETLVGICVERSLDLIVGILGILKAGGAYVPLDPEYPEERLAFVLEDARIAVLLTQAQLALYLPESSAPVVCMDDDWEQIAEKGSENLMNYTTAENLACVFYTSGSTGQPKGVAVPHRAIVRLLFGVEYVQLNADETFLHLASSSFDASTFEIWGALLHGAKCVLFPGKIPSPNEIGDILHHHKISTLWLTASLFNTVIDEAPEALSGVRQLLIGGEALSVPHVRRAMTLLPCTQITNGYGPTESTTFTCCYPIPTRLDESIESIPIGRPIANTEVYLLDSHLSPVPIGVPGEVFIAGDGLARGYLNRPEITAEKFIANPLSNEPGKRLYRTGDLARYLIDGNIEFLGRIDHQLKIRGFRIEPGEIEHALSEHPAVRYAVVIAKEETPGDKRLVAYVVSKEKSVTTATELRTYLRSKLPEYMIPVTYVMLDKLPLSPNGKIDHKLLSQATGSSLRDNQFTAPQTAVEKQLAEIWAQLLRVGAVSVGDNFFDLGGHSLLATQLVSRIRKTFQIELPLRVIFEMPTLAELARFLETHQWTTARSHVPHPDHVTGRQRGEI